MDLDRRLAEHGFESNESYDFPIACLVAEPPGLVRCLNVTGRGGRRKTAFANALAAALGFAHIRYHDFAHAPARALDRPSIADEASLSAFDRAVVEACGYSEAEPSALILDQLQDAPFAEHLRLERFLACARWPHPQGIAEANPRHLLVMLISEEPLYHGLHRLSFRVHTDRGDGPFLHHPSDFGLEPDAEPLFHALGELFQRLSVTPTASELRLLLGDLLKRVRDPRQLAQAIFGRVEGIEYEALRTRAILPALETVCERLREFLAGEPGR
jgi:hypothetical protein